MERIDCEWGRFSKAFKRKKTENEASTDQPLNDKTIRSITETKGKKSQSLELQIHLKSY